MQLKKIIYLFAAAAVIIISGWLIIKWQNRKDFQSGNVELTQIKTLPPATEQEDPPTTNGHTSSNEAGQTNPVSPPPPGKSRLTIRFLDVSTGYALIPEEIEMKLRGSVESSTLRSKKSDVAENGTMVSTLPNGTYDISVRKTGYYPMATYFDLKDNDLKVNFNLEPFYPRSELSSQYISTLHRQDALVVVGYVVDDKTGKPLPDVEVRPNDKIVSTTTDANGFFQFLLPLPEVKSSIANRNTLLFQSTGYTTEVRKNFDMWPNGDMILQIRMKKGEGSHEEKILLARNASISLISNAN